MLLVSIPLHPQPAKAGKNTPNTPPPADARSVPRGTENLPLVVHPDSRPRSQAEANWEQEKAAIEASQKHVEVFLTVLVALTGLLQAIILGLQWWLLRRQTNHTVTSERAWFWCKADISWTQNTPNQIIGQVGFTYVNSGKTPGFITEVGFAMDVLEKGKSLPETPGDYASEDFRKWGGRGLLVVPTNTISRLGALAATQAVFAQIKDGTSVVWVHGFVKYRDTFVNRQRESRYCFRWNPSQGTGESSFSMEGPETYNSAT
jgi:hypothetical protein